jgi:capsid protein
VIEADPHEMVTLVRDESANMVWGIERRIADGLGAGQDGTELARRFTATLAALMAQRAQAQLAPAATGAADTAPVPEIRYRLGTEVSENWIPFLPVHVGTGSRAIQLQRASMPRFVDPAAVPQHVRPRTTILRQGLTDDDALHPPSYFINEEEVPRAGVTVSGALRRARWFDGRTVIWHGRTATSGRGEVDSGLRFDVVDPVDVK